MILAIRHAAKGLEIAMARKKKGRRVSGWLVIDKPVGMTSTAVVNKVRWAFDAQKAGHSGTLDPAATGVLAIALGEATKTIPFVTDALKAYEFSVRWGQATNTDDAEGEIIENSENRPKDSEIEAALPRFTGEITQVPPAFSAVKIDGKRAYKLAREGEELVLEARPLHVAELVQIARPDADHSRFRMVCGKGGYVRSIARDLGQALGCFGHVISLRRIWSGPFGLDDAIDLGVIEENARTSDIDTFLLPLEDGLSSIPEVACTAEAAARLRHGNPAPVVAGSTLDYGETAWACHENRAVAVGAYVGGQLHPTRVFN